jgi:hypothetical protein
MSETDASDSGFEECSELDVNHPEIEELPEKVKPIISVDDSALPDYIT